MQVDLSIESEAWARLADAEALMGRAVAAALSVAGANAHGLSVDIVLADDATIKALNARWRGRDSATNVLSFPAAPVAGLPDHAPRPLGDIILSIETVQREASEQNKALATHTCHLVVHGTLHLLGYDHCDDVPALEMEHLEIEALEMMGLPNPYASQAGSCTSGQVI